MKPKTLYLTKILSILIFLALSSPLLAQKKIVDYVYTGVSASSIDFTKITHLNVAFENPVDAAGNLSYNANNTSVINAAHANNVKVLVSLCGGGMSNDPEMRARYFNLITPANRSAFINKIITYINQHNFDGVDLDLEGEAINSDYSGFVLALRSAMPAGKLLTAALSHVNGGGGASSAAIQSLDFLNVMAYDFGWGQPVHQSTYDFAAESAKWWVDNKQIAPGKVIVGVPFYGYTNTTGAGDIIFRNIVSTYGAAAANADTWTSGGNTIYYNGIPTIRRKTQLVIDQNYGGIMIWQSQFDATGSNSLLGNIYQMIGTSACSATPINPYVSVNNGSWQNTTSATLGLGGSVTIGPQPLSSGSWSWTGPNGFTSTSRQIKVTIDESADFGSYRATYTNACGASSNATFTISSNCSQTAITPYITVNGGSWQQTTSATLNAGGNLTIGPHPASGGSWVWSGPNGFTRTGRELSFSNVSSSQTGEYIATYTNTSGCKSALAFTITVNGTTTFSNTIEAENYVNASGVIKEECRDAGLGQNIGSFDAGDWMTYNINIPAAGSYKVTYRVASIYSGRTIRLEAAGGTPEYGTVTVPNTGSWQGWTSISHIVTLPAGSQQIALTTYTGGININRFNITNNLSSRIAPEEVPVVSTSNFFLFPNPVRNKLNFSTGFDNSSIVEIRDLSGVQLMKTTLRKGEKELDLSQLAPGGYIIKISSKSVSKTEKFYKE